MASALSDVDKGKVLAIFFFQAEDGIRDLGRSRGLGDVYKRQYLWCVNNEPGTPNQYSPERAAHEARKHLRGMLTTEQRGHGINYVLPIVRARP